MKFNYLFYDFNHKKEAHDCLNTKDNFKKDKKGKNINIIENVSFKKLLYLKILYFV